MPNSARRTRKTARLGEKAAARADHRIADDVEHQRRLAAPFVADPAENEGADEAHRQRQEQGVGDVGHADAEFLGDVLEREGQQEEVEGVERPAEIGGEHRLLLRTRQIHRRILPWPGASRRLGVTNALEHELGRTRQPRAPNIVASGAR